jgi:hypothetical protein
MAFLCNNAFWKKQDKSMKEIWEKEDKGTNRIKKTLKETNKMRAKNTKLITPY